LLKTKQCLDENGLKMDVLISLNSLIKFRSEKTDVLIKKRTFLIKKTFVFN